MLPKNINRDFYSDPNSFSTAATDNSLSNLYYQMSRHSPNPFKIQAVFFPKRINVRATAAVNTGNGFFQYTEDVMAALKNDPDTRNFDFSAADKRAGIPRFQHDNSAAASDNVIDYTVIVWRNTGSVFGILPVSAAQANGGNSGWATIGIELLHPDAGIRELFWEQFQELRPLLHETLGETWTWEAAATDAHGLPLSRICTELAPANLFNRDDWPALISFFKPRLMALDAFWTDAQYAFEGLK